jgi:hypothetical protein
MPGRFQIIPHETVVSENTKTWAKPETLRSQITWFEIEY